MTKIAIQSIESSFSNHIGNLDFWVSTMQLGAVGQINGVELTDQTTYASNDAALATINIATDFDGDNVDDHTTDNGTTVRGKTRGRTTPTH